MGLNIYNEIESNVRSYCRDVTQEFHHAQYEYIYDANGTRYLDFLAGSGALNYGHNDPDMKEALLSYISQNGIALGLDFHFDAKTRFLNTFNDRILKPRKMTYKMQFTGPTGTNSVEAAIKLARKVTGRKNVISFTNAFHGCSLGALATTGNASIRSTSEFQLNSVHRFPYDDYLGDGTDTTLILEKMLDDPSSGITDVAAIIFEVIQGEGGFNVATKSWAQSIQRIAKKHGILTIVDDIQSGCGRTGDFFGFESLDISPDIICTAKSMSGFGLPMAITLYKPELDKWHPAEHSGTFRGNGLAFITGIATLDKYWNTSTFSEGVKRKADLFIDKITEIAEKYSCKVKGRGLMVGLELNCPKMAHQVKLESFNLGLIIETCGSLGQTLKCLPPINTSEESLLNGVEILEKAFHNTYMMSNNFSVSNS